MADLTGIVKAKNAKVHLMTCDKQVRHYVRESEVICEASGCQIYYCLLARPECRMTDLNEHNKVYNLKDRRHK